MHSGIEMTTYAYQAVLGHLVDTEERKSEIANDFFYKQSSLRDDFNCFMDIYLKKLEELVEMVQVIDKSSSEKSESLNYLPFVIIGSTVEVESLDNQVSHRFKIISPYDVSNSKIDLSYVSGLGKALMLKRQDDVIEARLDKDVGKYRVKSIRYEC